MAESFETPPAAADTKRYEGPRYVTRWNEDRQGYGVWDQQYEQWARRPTFNSERIATAIARGLNEEETKPPPKAKPPKDA
jgi:hypothetical protein